MAQCDARVGGSAAPAEGLGVRDAVSASGSRLSGQGWRFGEAAVQALASQDNLLAFGPVESTAVARRMVLLEASHQAVDGLLAEGLVQGLGHGRVDVVADQNNLLGLGEVDLCPFHRTHTHLQPLRNDRVG